MTLSRAAVKHLDEVHAQLFHEQEAEGLVYGTSMLSSPDVDDTYDPDMKLRPCVTAGYWPGEIEGHQYVATVLGGADGNAERVFVRRLALGATIGPAALERHRQYEDLVIRRLGGRGISAAFGPAVVPGMMEVCREKSVPFAYLVAGQIVESAVMPSGTRVATLFYPSVVHPETALARLRRVVWEVESEEVL